jgi:hypothetical protein
MNAVAAGRGMCESARSIRSTQAALAGVLARANTPERAHSRQPGRDVPARDMIVSGGRARTSETAKRSLEKAYRMASDNSLVRS